MRDPVLIRSGARLLRDRHFCNLAAVAGEEQMFVRMRKVLEWQADDRSFTLVAEDDEAALTSPDGQCFSMSMTQWQALRRALQELLGEAKPRRVDRVGKASNHGQPWDASLDRQLIDAWNAGATPGDLAEQMGRSRGGIGARLVIVGVVNSRDDAELKSRQRQLHGKAPTAAVGREPAS